jgi:hypothetical protein
MDADAELDPFSGRDARIALRHSALRLDRTARCVDDAAEFHKQPIAGGLDDAPVMPSDL